MYDAEGHHVEWGLLLPFPELPGIHSLHTVEEAGEGGDFCEMEAVGNLSDT